MLVYRKRLRRRLDDYERNVPPHVRAARLADDYNDRLGRPRQYQRGGWISYVISVNGPEPLEVRQAPIDYDHYVTRQLQPVADAILPFVNDDFSTLVGGQMGEYLGVIGAVGSCRGVFSNRLNRRFFFCFNNWFRNVLCCSLLFFLPFHFFKLPLAIFKALLFHQCF